MGDKKDLFVVHLSVCGNGWHVCVFVALKWWGGVIHQNCLSLSY